MKNLHWWLLILCVPLYGFWTMPYLSDTRPSLQQALKVEVVQKDRLGEQFSALKTQQKELAASGDEVTPTDRIPPEMEQEYLLLDLRRITQGAGFSSGGFSFKKGENSDTKAAEMNVTFAAQGNRSNLVALLEAIEANPRFMGLNSLTFGSVGTNQDLINLSLDIYALAQRF